MISRNIRKTYYNTFAAFAIPAHGQTSKEAPKKTNQLIDKFYVLSGIFIEKMLFLGILSIQCKIRSDRSTDTRRSTSRYDRPVGHPWSISMFELHFF